MATALEPKLKSAVGLLVQDLVAGRYSTTAESGRGGRLSEQELRRAITEYGRTLVPIPSEGWDLVELYPLRGERHVFALDVPLWTLEEGRSDLTLSLTATKIGTEYRLDVDDLHVE